MQQLFLFEHKAGKPLARIPIIVRFKLDSCGIKLPMRGWARLSQERKWQLVWAPCASMEEKAAYRTILAEFAGDLIADLNPESGTAEDVASARCTEVPLPVMKQCNLYSLPAPSIKKWSALSDLQRFALIKLSREGHKNEHFLSAVEEFGLFQFATPANYSPAAACAT